MSKLTPMMAQYHEIKSENRDAILFFRLGDFYEMFGQDAVEASKILGITLTARNKKTDPIPMCGVPHHAAENYIAKLTRAGKKVAICDQVSDASLPGIVKRKVVRIITPGTTFNDNILQPKQSAYIAALFPKKDYFGLAFADLTTGEFQATEFSGKDALKTELLRLNPAEIVLSEGHYSDPEIRALLAEITEVPVSSAQLYEEAQALLLESFHVRSLEAFGIGNWPFAIQAAGVLMRYLLDTQKNRLAHVDRITAYYRERWMKLDESSLRNLELFSTLHGQEREGTLLSVLDHTESAMGGRLLRRWLAHPLLKKNEIEQRHGAVENFMENDDLRNTLRQNLSVLLDLERLLGRLAAGAGNARDLGGLGHSLALIPGIKTALSQSKSSLLRFAERELVPLTRLTENLDKAIKDEPKIKLTEGGLIKTGYNPELDELHELMNNAKSALRRIEEQERQNTGIPSLKVGFNKVFGYYIEVTKTHSEKVPEHYLRKQTLANAERYITEELKDYEEKVLTAEERAKALEYELFMELRTRTLDYIQDIKKNAQVLAQLDVLLSFALVAIKRNYCRPEITIKRIYEIEKGRHPVVESMSFEQKFTPNGAEFHEQERHFKLITGPNMSGKSTYLRQVALIALMAQIGSFVPADRVLMPVFDRIFTRVGASDKLVKGQSTFMVEMQEAAYILNHATENSLIILDEIGRGTSTYDGLSLAWAILEHLHDHTGAFTLFATHYHELIPLAEQLPFAKNLSVQVKESPKGVLFLHQIQEGGTPKSYGIEVAKLAGMPPQLVQRATAILKDLETEEQLHQRDIPQNQMDLFDTTYGSTREPGKLTHPALDRLTELNVNDMTPLEALNALNELKGL